MSHFMASMKALTLTGVAALGAALFVMAPASGAPGARSTDRNGIASLGAGVGYFTPAAADPRLAAIFARGGFNNQGFRFTPVSVGRNRAVTVAVRATTGNRSIANLAMPSQATAIAPSPAPGLQPLSYSLGAAVGWKRFALTGEANRVDIGTLPVVRDRSNTGVSYNSRKWSSRLQVAPDRPVGLVPRTANGSDSLSVDVGGSYRLTRNLDVTAGVRYRQDRDRLEPRVDDRRDSQAVYVGTAFRF
jgi:hypothetical protein